MRDASSGPVWLHRLRRRRRLLGLLAGGLAALSLASCGGGEAPSPASQGSVSGRVVLIGSPPRAGVAVSLAVSGGSRTTLTRDDGTYAFEEVPPGTHGLVATLVGTVEETSRAIVEVSRGRANAPDLTFTLRGSITGRLVLSGLPPEAGLLVSASGPGGLVSSTLTDSSGTFSIPGLPPGRYVLSAPVEFTAAPSEPLQVVVPAGGAAAATVVLSPHGSLEAPVVIDGAPATSGAPCRLTGPGLDLAAVTDADGRCAFPDDGLPGSPGLPSAEYLLSATVVGTVEGTIAQPVAVGRGPTLAPALHFTRSGSIGGMVFLEGFPDEADFRVTAQMDGGPLLEAFTGPQSPYTFRDVTPGTYAITAHVPRSREGQLTSVVSVEAGGWAVAHFSFSPDAEVTGAVRLGAEPPPQGTVCTLRGWAGELQAATAPDGSFRFTEQPGGGVLRAGSFVLSVSLPSTREATVEVGLELRRPVTAVPEVRFSPEGSLAGLVTLPDGAPGSGALVWVEGTGDAVRCGADGGYRFPRLPTGPQRVRAVLGGHQPGSIEGLAVSWNAEVRAPPIALLADPPGLPTTASLAGIASVAGLGPQAGVDVSVEGLGRSARSGAGGAWRIDGVPPGQWALSLTLGERTERVPAAAAIPGTDGFLVDDRLYPIGEIELQGGRRICQDCRPDRSGRLAGGRGLVVERETRLLAVPVDGGPIILLADDLRALRDVTPDAAVGAPCHVVYDSIGGDLKAVPCAGGPALRLTPGPGAGRFSPDGRRYLADATDGMIWHADLERLEARPVVAGKLGELLGPDHMGFSDTARDVFGSLAWSDGTAVPLTRAWSTVELLDGGGRLLVFPWRSGGGNLGGALVGPVAGPLQVIVDPAAGLWVSKWSISPDQTAVAMGVVRLAPYESWMEVVSTSDGRRIATLPGPARDGLWSPDSRVYVVPGAGTPVILLDGSVPPALPCTPERFSDDGLLAACRGADRLYVLDTRAWGVVASLSLGAPSGLLGFTPEGAALWASDAAGLHRLDVASGAGASLPAPGHSGAAFSPDRRWIAFETPGGRWQVAPASGGPAVAVNPPELPATHLVFLGASDTVAFWTGSGAHLVPATGGTPIFLGEGAPGGPPVLAGLAPGGGALSWISPELSLRSVALPFGEVVEAAAGIGSFRHLLGGIEAWTLSGEVLVGPEVGPLRALGPGVVALDVLPSTGRLAVRDALGSLAAVRVLDGESFPLATCPTGADDRWPEIHGDRVVYSCGGVLHAVPAGGGAAAPSIRGGGPAPVQWLGPRHFLATRTGALPPFRFQDGTYLVTVP